MIREGSVSGGHGIVVKTQEHHRSYISRSMRFGERSGRAYGIVWSLRLRVYACVCVPHMATHEQFFSSEMP